MSFRKLLTGACLVAFGLTLLALSGQRTIAYSLAFPHKETLASDQVSEVDVSSAIDAYKQAYSWHDHPDFLIAQSRLLAKSPTEQGQSKPPSSYNDRILLIEAALQKGGYNPYQSFVLSNLRYLYGWELQTVVQSLKLSIATGPYVGALYLPRFRSIAALWDKLSPEQKAEFLPAVKKAYNRHRGEVMALTKADRSAFDMVRAALQDEPRELINFVREFLKK